MKVTLKEYKKVEEAYEKFEYLYDLFIKENKRKPVAELWLSFMGEKNKQIVGLVCYYEEKNKSELEFYKNNL